ncbi:hypothetical protein AAFF_G00215360 [Aldrovandia affinis]|uniref:Uncharacterized protein n=1 Tax=Aldrovandia affinis TaxID=143900 RepID=A0AAD7RGE8_9TELE|nr:hypothetical protein AAFF_G00215360 [Aldrovandia affinis]
MHSHSSKGHTHIRLRPAPVTFHFPLPSHAQRFGVSLRAAVRCPGAADLVLQAQRCWEGTRSGAKPHPDTERRVAEISVSTETQCFVSVSVGESEEHCGPPLPAILEGGGQELLSSRRHQRGPRGQGVDAQTANWSGRTGRATDSLGHLRLRQSSREALRESEMH